MASMVASSMLTRADLDALPDDNLRHELIDGQFVMTPAPGFAHQTMVGALGHRLWQALRGSDLKVLSAPFDVVLGPHVVEPDLLVARRADFTSRDLPVAPLLAVEVLSPSTARMDSGRKRDLYAEAGVAHYWLLDPAEPAITMLTLVDGHYVESGHTSGDEAINVEQPAPLTFSAAELLAD